MHEFDIVKSLLDELVPQLQQQGVKRVVALRFQRGSTFSEDALRFAFASLSQGTILEGAELIVETVETPFQCACGFQKVLTHDDLIGHMFICPQCGQTQEIDEAHELALLEVIADVDEPKGNGA